MSHKRWGRHEDEGNAVDELLDAAGRAFASLGVGSASMVDIAAAAGCSRATLYRYFPNQEALHLAYVHRATLRIAHRLADERLLGAANSFTDRILAGINAVRDDPSLAVWFEPENMAVPIKVSQSSDLLRAMSVGLVDQTEANQTGANQTENELHIRAEIERRGEWLLRSIVSLLAMPGRDAESERAMIDSFIIPVLVGTLPVSALPLQKVNQ